LKKIRDGTKRQLEEKEIENETQKMRGDWRKRKNEIRKTCKSSLTISIPSEKLAIFIFNIKIIINY
jgi:hypothetical protein